ncbi:hypothetical protein [Streptomyces sp. NPDC018347]|uniref:hypothetical protein n=1 Tax=Streptomyces sp. NPDC018347 TaxID=3157193 RepID=UPI0033F5FA91
MRRSSGGPRSRHWSRVLVLLLALWVPAAHAPARTAPYLAAVAGSAEHDVLDTALRLPARAVHRADAPERPAPLTGPAPVRPAAPRPGPPRMPSAPPLLRTVVLRC